MKKIAMSLATIAFVALLATGATRALFSDNTSNLTGITFSTGNADLRITQVCSHQWYDGSVTLNDFNSVYAGCQFNLNNGAWYPGKTVSQVIYLGNFSTADIALHPTVQLTNYSETVGGLQNVMSMKIWWNGNAVGTDWHSLNYFRTHAVSLPDIAHPSATPPSGANGGVLGLTIQVQMDPSAGNGYQNGNVNFDFHFNAEQVH